MNVWGVLIFAGETNHTILGDGESNSINITLNPVLNDIAITVPVISSINFKETVGSGKTTTINTTVNNIDNGTLRWRYEAYQTDSFGFANQCPESKCGNFSPSDNTSRVGYDNVSQSQGKFIHQINSVYTAPDNVSEQNLRIIVSNHSGIGVESRFKIKVTGPVDSGVVTTASPAILSIIANRIKDNTSCPNYDCLSLEATVDDDGPFSDLSTSWAYSPSGSRSFSDNSSLVSTSDNTQGRFRAVFNGYRDSDAGKITLTVTDAGNRQGVLELPLVPNGYPLTPICDSSGQDCYTPQVKEPQFLIITHQPESSGYLYIQETNAGMPYWQQAQTKILSSTNTQSWDSLNQDMRIDVNYDHEITFSAEHLIFEGGRFIAVGRSSYNNFGEKRAVIESADGLQWDMITPELKVYHDNGSGLGWYPLPSERFAYGNGRYVAMNYGESSFYGYDSSVGYHRYQNVYQQSFAYVTTDNLSKDNVSWQVTDNGSMLFSSPYTLEESPELKHIMHDGNRYLAFENKSIDNKSVAVFESKNGQTWSHLGQIGDNFSGNFEMIGTAYGNGKYVAVFSQEGSNHCCGNSVEDRMATMVSDNGSNWVIGHDNVQVAKPGGGYKNPAPEALTFGAGKFVTVDNQTVVGSTDGVSWSSLGELPESASIKDLEYGNGIFLALESDLGSGGYPRVVELQTSLGGGIFKSTDGNSWTKIFDNITFDNGSYGAASILPEEIVFGDGLFAAFGYRDNRTIITSSDGLNWQLSGTLSDNISGDRDRVYAFGEVQRNSSLNLNVPPRVTFSAPGNPEGANINNWSRQVRYYDAQKFLLKFNQPVRFENWEFGNSREDCNQFDIDFKRLGDQQCYEFSAIEPRPDNNSVVQPYYADKYLFFIGENLNNNSLYIIKIDNISNSIGVNNKDIFQTTFRTRN